MGSSNQQYRERDRRALWHPYTAQSALDKPFPVITRGEGVYLWDADGRRFLDAISSWWACNLGHGHPRLVQAIQRQAAKLQHSILGNLSHPPAIELAERLAGLFGPEARRIFFAGDGASAVEAALKIAVQYWHNIGHPERRRFVALKNAYHGDTLGAVSVGMQESFHKPFLPLLFPVFRAEAPFCAGCRRRLAPETCRRECLVAPSFAGKPRSLPRGKMTFLASEGFAKMPRALARGASLESILDRHGAEVAAVIVEPLCQGAAGMRLSAPACLAKIAELCRRHQVLLIADEIAVGYGRTGRMFACEHAGVDPDIVCLGKGMSGGYLPISATVVKHGIYETFNDQPADRTFYHGHTFAGNPIAAALALEVLRVYREEGIVARAERLGHLLRRQMERFADLPGIKRVRTLGMIAALDLEDAHGQPAPARACAVREALLAEGILLRPLANTLYLMPPLIISEDVLTGLTDQLYCALKRS